MWSGFWEPRCFTIRAIDAAFHAVVRVVVLGIKHGDWHGGDVPLSRLPPCIEAAIRCPSALSSSW